MYTLKEVMNMMSMPERTIRRHIKLGILPGTKVGGTWRFTEEDISYYLSNQTIAHTQEHKRLNEILDQIHGISSIDNQILVIKQLPKLSLNRQKDISLLASNAKDSMYFHLNREMDKTIVTFKGSEVDTLNFLENLNNLLER